MLDPVQVALLAEQAEELLLPRALQQAAQVLDRVEPGIAREHQREREAVVGVDEKGHALLARERREAIGGQCRPTGQHRVECGLVPGQLGVPDARLKLAGQPGHMPLEQRVPGGVAVVKGQLFLRKQGSGAQKATTSS